MSERAVRAVAVARGYGLDVTDPRVVPDLSNVLVHLAPLPVVARVANTTAAVRPGRPGMLARDMELARWLAARGGAVVAPADELPPGAHSEDGFALTFWRLVDPQAERPSAAQAGRELRELHERLDGFGSAARRRPCGQPAAHGAWPALDRLRGQLRGPRRVGSRLPCLYLEQPACCARRVRLPGRTGGAGALRGGPGAAGDGLGGADAEHHLRLRSRVPNSWSAGGRLNTLGGHSPPKLQ